MHDQQGSSNLDLVIKPFPLNPKYLVTSEGDILSQKNSKKMSPANLRGYKRLPLMIDGKRKSFLVHRVVAITFLENPHNLGEVNHKNGIKGDNRLCNLEWVSREDNQKHAFKNNLNTNKGTSNGRCILTEKEVVTIYERLLAGDCEKTLAEEYKISSSGIRGIMSKTNWTELLKDFEDISIKAKRPKMTNEQFLKCVSLREEGYSCSQMADELGLSLYQTEGVFSAKSKKKLENLQRLSKG